MEQTNRLCVTIDGDEYVLKSVRPQSEIQQVADYVEGKIREAKYANKRATPLMRTTLAAVNITDELFRQREEWEALQKEAEIPMRAYEPMRRECEDLKQECEVLKEQLQHIQQAYEEAQCAQERAEKRAKELESLWEKEKRSTQDKAKDLVELRKHLKEAEDKQIDLAKQYQEYRRTHR